MSDNVEEKVEQESGESEAKATNIFVGLDAVCIR